MGTLRKSKNKIYPVVCKIVTIVYSENEQRVKLKVEADDKCILKLWKECINQDTFLLY